MRIGIVVDSACDLPQDFIAEHNIVLLPITVRIGEAVLADHRDEQATLSFLHAHVAEHGAEAETIPFSVNQIRDLFLQQLVIDYDHVFCMTITKTRSPTTRCRPASPSSTTTSRCGRRPATTRRSRCACSTPRTCSPRRR